MILLLLNKLKRWRSGQIAPLLIVFIAIMIVAVMFLVNVGKVGMTKINTANAADAGALASASVLASGLNGLAEINQKLKLQFLAFQLVMITRIWPYKMAPYHHPAYYMFVANQTYACYQARRIAKDLPDGAHAPAYKHAFSNLGIDEQKRVRVSGEEPESYDEWRKRPSTFSEWFTPLEGGHFKGATRSGEGLTYPPEDPTKVPNAPWRESGDSVTVRVSGIPDEFHVSFQPMVIVYLYLAEKSGHTVILPGFMFVPWAWIRSVSPERPEVSVTTTRVEPGGEDLGIWQMRYPDITSSATAKVHEGSIHSPGSYDLRLIRAD